MKYVFFVAALSLSVCVLDAKKFPSFIQRCKRDDPELSNCFKNALLKFRKYLPGGVEELRISPMNPFSLDSISLVTSWMDVALRKIKLYNAFDYEVDDFKIDLESNTMWLNLTQKYMELNAHYDVSGQFLQFGLQGSGKMELNFTDTKTASVFHGTRIQKKGKEYLNLESLDFKLLTNSIDYFHLHDLFKDNLELTDRVNDLLIDNMNELAVELVPLTEEVISKIMMSIFKAVFDTYSLNELFI